MLKKIVSSGYPGVERAALDVARKQFIDFGGWIPKWRADEDPELVKNYRMRVMERDNFVKASERNIVESDGVLIIADGDPAGNAALNRRLADRHDCPHLYIDLRRSAAYESARRIEAWISQHNIETLAVSGPKDSQSLDLYITVTDILDAVFQLLLIRDRGHDAGFDQGASITDRRLVEFIRVPRTAMEAVNILMANLSFHDRTRIANMSETRLHELTPSLGMYLKNEFRLWQTNEALIRDCRSHAESSQEEPVSVIIRMLWQTLKKSENVLRVVK